MSNKTKPVPITLEQLKIEDAKRMKLYRKLMKSGKTVVKFVNTKKEK